MSTDKVSVDKWHKVELAWDVERGLQMYVDGQQVGNAPTPAIHLPLRVNDRVVYVGRPTSDNLSGRYADATVDELDFWYAGRNRLIALGLLDVGKSAAVGLLRERVYKPLAQLNMRKEANRT